MEQTVLLGEEVELAVGLEPMDGVSMSEMDFSILVFTQPGKAKVEFQKDACFQASDDSYTFILDTSKVGVGTIVCVVIAYIPDSRTESRNRKQLLRINSGIRVVNPY